MKKIIILFALQFASIRFYAQQNNLVPLSNEFNRCLEFSGLTIIHGKFYLLAEKCHVLVSNDNNKPDTIDLSKLVAGDAQLEGITMKNDTAFLIDEKKPAVYAYCVSSKKKIEVALKGIDLDGYTGNRGIEGIAMHPAGKFLYIARENDGNSQSEMLTFSITSQNDKLILNFIDRTFIKHEDKRTRIADIYYVPGKNQLYAIISTYDKASGTGEYFLDFINIKNNSKQQPVPDLTGKKISDRIYITSEVNEYKTDFSTNMEGLVIRDGYAYLISDNLVNEGGELCTTACKKTLFLKLRL